MDFDYVEDNRPNLRLQSGGSLAAAAGSGEDLIVDRKHAGICIGVGLLLIFISAWFQASGLAQLAFIWVALSLFLGPFAPASITAGDCRVGQGEVLAPLEHPSVDLLENERKNVRSRRKAYRAPELLELERSAKQLQNGVDPVDQAKKKVDGEWTEEELSMLKKQLAKHPRGTARRWQVIAESFNGSRTVEDVIHAAKDVGSKKPGDGDAYATFLAQRKVSSKQIASDTTLRKEFEVEEPGAGAGAVPAGANGNGSAWSDSEDKALLGALKMFPKDSAMRWERIAEEVGGRSKAQCLKRYSELRDAFRSSKGVPQ